VALLGTHRQVDAVRATRHTPRFLALLAPAKERTEAFKRAAGYFHEAARALASTTLVTEFRWLI
jgi:hypothetical protein